MNCIPFWKVESIGNDFVLVNAEGVARVDLVDFARKACARRFGIGSDGLLVVQRQDGGLSMRMFNPDGSEDFCGNGLRCAAEFGRRQAWVSSEFRINHGHQTIPVEIHGKEILMWLGAASYEPAAVPHRGERPLLDETLMVLGHELRVSALTTGSTHTVIQAAGRPADADFVAIGAALEHHPMFPLRTSVIWSWPIGDGSGIEIRIWERGVGETLGCGTGSSAAAVEHFRLTGERSILVQNPGGPIRVEASGLDERISVRGTAQVLWSGDFPI